MTTSEAGRTGELKVVVLVPMLQGEHAERGRVGKLQVCKVPVKDLAVAGGQVDSTAREGSEERGACSNYELQYSTSHIL